MSFTETVFPEYISEGSSGGPGFSTDIVMTRSGFETRNVLWAQVRHAYDVSTGINGPDEYETVKNFFMAMNGRAHGFLFKDPMDYKSCNFDDTPTALDEDIGNGDGTETDFQLIKTYTQGLSEVRNILKPKSGSVLVAIDGVAYAGGWSVSLSTGIITFDDATENIDSASSNGDGSTRLRTTTSHELSGNQSVYLTGFTGDWAGLNNTRYGVEVVSSNEIDVIHDSSGYTAYSSNGGQLDTIPQSGEAITAGYEFYVPVRFDTDQMTSNYLVWQIAETQIPIVEIRL